MNCKIKSLTLLLSIGLYSISPLKANRNYYNEDYLPNHQKLVKLVSIQSNEWPGDSSEWAEEYKKKSEKLTQLINVDIKKEIETQIEAQMEPETEPLRTACLHCVQGEAQLQKKHFYSLLHKNKPLTLIEQAENASITLFTSAYFKEALQQFEEVYGTNDSEKFQNIYHLQPGTALLYAKAIRTLVDLEEDTAKKLPHLKKLAFTVKELLKKDDVLANAPSANGYFSDDGGTIFTRLAPGNRLAYLSHNFSLDNYLNGGQFGRSLVLSAIEFEIKWLEELQEKNQEINPPAEIEPVNPPAKSKPKTKTVSKRYIAKNNVGSPSRKPRPQQQKSETTPSQPKSFESALSHHLNKLKEEKVSK